MHGLGGPTTQVPLPRRADNSRDSMADRRCHITPAFDVILGDATSSVVLHVPHSSTRIPADVRSAIVLDDDALTSELLRMTDAHTDRIALTAADGVSPRPWVFVNRISRLVVDPERFPDDREEMQAVGMGAVYTRTSDGDVLRRPDAEAEQRLLSTYFDPYAAAMTDLVADRLAATGSALIVDVHSYPSRALPYELHADARRPALCIGQDPFHTTEFLVEAAGQAFEAPGDSVVDEPFAGAYVPTRWYGLDRRVNAIMLEVRRDTYLDEVTGEPTAGIDEVAAATARFLNRTLENERWRKHAR
jgi:N-formylglutamate deformylase